MTDPLSDPELESLLTFLRETRNLDFTGYKRTTLSRRIHRRLESVGIDDLEEYRDLLEADPIEQIRLTDTILINVTSFYRDEAVWNHLRDEIIPAIVARKAPDEQIRVWSAGCASGQEAYSIAMLLADHVGLDDFKSRVKVFATDVDDAALAEARSGAYTFKEIEDLPTAQRDTYFEPSETGFVFRKDCRRSVIFGRHDITMDAPISRIDLLLCRNVLMYFLSETQRRALQRFHYALDDGGLLVLGKAETVFAHSDLFVPVEGGLRIFKRTDRRVRIDRPPTAEAAIVGVERSPDDLQALAAMAAPVAELVINLDGRLVAANAQARLMFSITENDLGEPFSSLDVSVRPLELRDHIERVYQEFQPVVIHDVRMSGPDGKDRFLEVTIVRLRDRLGNDLGAAITYADVSEIGRARVGLEALSSELKRSNEELRSVNIRLEASNEELQSTNEELETTNEELQSANEELETMNEELRSANEELETMNEELLRQATEIEESKRFVAATLDSLGGGVAVLSKDLDVMIWNEAARDLFGLREDEARGRSFLALDIGLPVGEIGPLLHALVSEDSADDDATHTPAEAKVVELDAVDRRGRPMRCRVTVRRFSEQSPEPDAELIVFIDRIATEP